MGLENLFRVFKPRTPVSRASRRGEIISYAILAVEHR